MLEDKEYLMREEGDALYNEASTLTDDQDAIIRKIKTSSPRTILII